MTLKVRDVMTTKVITVTPDTDFKTIATLLDRHRINLLPVLDEEHRVVGVVSEADLLAKAEWQGRKPPGRFERWLLEDQLRRASASVASDMMTREVATTKPDVRVGWAAREMQVLHLKALPVVDDDGRLVGIVSRADLLKTFVRPDQSIRREIIDDVLRGTLAIDPKSVVVRVSKGRVELKGKVETRSLSEIIARLVSAVPGVVDVFNALDYSLDDSHIKTTTEPADELTYTGPPLR
jgi:CBS-domain-containing membrane protein